MAPSALSGHGTVPTVMAIAMPMTKPPNIRPATIPSSQLAVAALLGQARLRVRVAAAGDVRRLEALRPGDPGARGVVRLGIRRQGGRDGSSVSFVIGSMMPPNDRTALAGAPSSPGEVRRHPRRRS